MIPGKRAGHGRRKPGVMNRLEAKYAEVLKVREWGGEIAWWKYEGITFKLADDTRFTPDFAVMLEDGAIEFHETKGFMREDAWLKLKIASAQFPFVFRLCKHSKEKGWEIREIK